MVAGNATRRLSANREAETYGVGQHGISESSVFTMDGTARDTLHKEAQHIDSRCRPRVLQG